MVLGCSEDIFFTKYRYMSGQCGYSEHYVSEILECCLEELIEEE